MATKQEKIFDNMAKDVCDQALEGYSGTIFAYGQTGSGKTFTMTGGIERFSDRGIIPRTISYLFDQSRKRTDLLINLTVSYMEIYGNSGYDLLDEKHDSTKLEDLPRVIPRETEDEQLILSGLSLHKVETEENAFNLLYIGDNNRIVCETPKNDASTRSHCIFTIIVETRKPASDVKTVSRIHLVDLSGSERIGKTGVEGKLAQEARGINLSLHYLEHVIVCLNKHANGENIHIPYRNSLMTMVLRDSLGGNCMTRMIATISPQEEDMDESISTCRFAQRVALIKNYVVKNESVDPAVIIDRLKRENAQLKAELALLKGGDVKDSLEAEDIEECKKKVQEFLEARDPTLKINECFYYFKHIYNDLARKLERGGGVMANKSGAEGVANGGGGKAKALQNNYVSGGDNSQTAANSSSNNQQYLEEIKRLKLLIQQRDNEIMILLNLVNKNKGSENGQGFLLQQQLVVPVSRAEGSDSDRGPLLSSMMRESRPISFPKMLEGSDQSSTSASQQDMALYEKGGSKSSSITSQPSVGGAQGNGNNQSTRIGSDVSQYSRVAKVQSDDLKDISVLSNLNNGKINPQEQIKKLQDVQNMLLFPLNLSNEQLMDRANCFELFRKSYRKNEIMEENKNLLKDKYSAARQLGTLVNNARQRISDLKTEIESLRKEAALKGLVEGNDEYKHPEEERVIQEIEKQKRIYKENFEKLKDQKNEIERIQQILEKNKDRLQKDFEKWLGVMLDQRKAMMGAAAEGLNENRSDVSNTSKKSQDREIPKVKDSNVQKKLEAFYKARDEIYKAPANI